MPNNDTQNKQRGINTLVNPYKPVESKSDETDLLSTEKPEQSDDDFTTNAYKIAEGYKPDDIDADRWRTLWQGVILQESNADTNTKESSYGRMPKGKRAYGVAQVLPATAQEMGFTEDEIKTDPLANFAAGVKYLRSNYERIRQNKNIVDDNHALAATIASYHAGPGRVIESLDSGGDGVPDVDDGAINTRDYTKNILDKMTPYLKRIQERESAEAIKVNEDYTDAQATANAQSGMTIQQPEKPVQEPSQVQGEVLKRGRVLGPGEKTYEDVVADADRAIREQLGLTIPKTHPHNVSVTAPVRIPIVPVQGKDEADVLEKVAQQLNADVVSDAIVDTLTGAPGQGAKFRQAVGENPGEFSDDITKEWVKAQLESGAMKVISDPNRPDVAFVEANIPAMNYVKNRVDAFAQGGVEAVKQKTNEMRKEIRDSERLVAETEYGNRIREYQALLSKAKTPEEKASYAAQIESLKAELDNKYPVEEFDLARAIQGPIGEALEGTGLLNIAPGEVWKGIKLGLAQGYSQLAQTGVNLKNVLEAGIHTNDQEYIKYANARDEKFKRVQAALANETPEARTFLGQTIAGALKEAIYLPVYVAGGEVFGPSGLIYTTALRDADKPFDQAVESIAAAVFEVPASKLARVYGGKFVEKVFGDKVSDRVKDQGLEMFGGGLGEATGDAVVEVFKGKVPDFKQALQSFIIGAAFEAGAGGREGAESEKRESLTQPTSVELRSPILLTQDKEGNPRYQAIVKIGNKAGVVEIPKTHPFILKYADEVAKGNLQFLGVSEEQFDQALTDFAGEGKVKLPKLTAQQAKTFMEMTNKQPATEAPTESEVTDARESGQQQIRVEVEDNRQTAVETGKQGINQQEGKTGAVLQERGELQEEPRREVSELGEEVLSSIQKKLDTTDVDAIQELIRNANKRYAVKNTPEQQRIADEAFAKVSQLSPEENKALSQVLPAGVYMPVKQPEEGKRGSYSRAIEDIASSESDAQLDANLRELTKFFSEKKQEGQEGQAPQGKTVKSQGIDITLPPDLAARWDRVTSIEREAVNKLTGNYDAKVQARRDIAKQKKAAQQQILTEYRVREDEATERGYIRDTNKPVVIVSRQGDYVQVSNRLGGETQTLLASEVETRKERDLKPVKKARLPMSVRLATRLGKFDEGLPRTISKGGVIYMNNTAQNAIEQTTGVDIGPYATIRASQIDEVISALETEGYSKLAAQIKAQTKATGNVAFVNVTKDKTEAGVARRHESIHVVALDKRLTEQRLEKLFRDGGPVERLFNETKYEDFRQLSADDIVQEVLAYGLTGDTDVLEVSPDILYDATLDVVQAYLDEFPKEDITKIAENALINFEPILNKAEQRRKRDAERTSSKEVRESGKTVESGKAPRGKERASIRREPEEDTLRKAEKRQEKVKTEAEKVSETLVHSMEDIVKLPAFKRWFGKSEVKDEDGPLIVFHGTTHDFDIFSLEKANIENYIGAGFYFTTNPRDASKNYGAEGADLQARISSAIEYREQEFEEMAEELESQLDDIEDETEREGLETRIEQLRDSDYIRQAVTEEMTGKREVVVMPAYLKAVNLFDIRDNANYKKVLEGETEVDEEGELTGNEIGTYFDFLEVMDDVLSDFVDRNYVEKIKAQFIDATYNKVIEWGSVTHKEVFDALKDATIYLDENLEGEVYDKYRMSSGQMPSVSSEVMRQVIEKAGYDGFAMTATSVFSDRLMSDVEYDNRGYKTEHYIVWKPTQIKSPFNTGKFSPKNPSILKKRAREDMAPIRKEENFKAWFGNSVVRHDNNKPMTVFHSTYAWDDFNEFNRTRDIGFHFGTYVAADDRIVNRTFNEVPERSRTIPAYLRIENPLVIDDVFGSLRSTIIRLQGKSEIFDEETIKPSVLSEEFDKNFKDLEELRDNEDITAAQYNRLLRTAVVIDLEAQGYDGIKYKNYAEDVGSYSYVVFRPEQIKSPFNEGSFSNRTSDFLRKRSGVDKQVDEINRKAEKNVTAADVKTIVQGGTFALLSAQQGKGKLDEARLKVMQRELNRQGYKVFETNDNRLFVMLKNKQDIPNIIRTGIKYKQRIITVGENGEYRAPNIQAGTEKYGFSNAVIFDKGGVEVDVNGNKVSFYLPELNETRPRGKEEQGRVKTLLKAFKKSFQGRAQMTSGDFLDWLGKRQEQGKRESLSTLQTAEFLESTTEELYGAYPNPNKMTKEEYDAQRVRRAVRDGLSFIKAFTKNKTGEASGKSWYAESIDLMHQKIGEAFPEINSVPQLRALWDVMLAVSSQGNKVFDNYNATVKLWRRIIEEFKLGESEIDGIVVPVRQADEKLYGRFGPQLDKFNMLSKGYIPANAQITYQLKKQGRLNEIVKSEFDIPGATKGYVKDEELQSMIDKYGRIGGVMEYLLEPGSDENHPYKATEILGPKIGAFFLNIAGFSQLVTVDMWASRWFYRLNGGLTNETEATGIQDTPLNSTEGDMIRGVMQAIAEEWNQNHKNKIEPSDVQAILWYGEKDIWSKAGAKDSGQVDFYMAAQRRIPEVLTDIDGIQKEREQVIKDWVSNAPDVGPKTKGIGAVESTEANKQFFIRQMSIPARIGLSKGSKKQTMNRSLLNGDPVTWNLAAERAAGRKLEPQESADLGLLLNDFSQATTKTEKDKALDELNIFLDNLSKQPVIEFLLNVRRAGLLSGISTIGRNLTGNFAFAIAKELERGAAAPLDMIVALMSTDKQRTVQGVSPRGIAYAMGKGFTEGVSSAFRTIIKGNPGANYETFNLGSDPRSGYKWLDYTVGQFAKYIFRLQGAGDALFRSYAYHRALYETAALSQKNGGRSIQEVLTDPSTIESDMAWRAAEVMVFQNDNAFNTRYQEMKQNQPGFLKAYLDYKAPFIKTGSNIFKQLLNYAVIGGVYDVSMALKNTQVDQSLKGWEKTKEKMWQAIDTPETREIIVKSVSSGMVGLTVAYIGFRLAAAGILFGADDGDDEERRRREALGAGAGNMHIGERWYDIKSFAPFSSILIAGASLQRALSKEAKDLDKRINLVTDIVSTMLIDGLPLARQAKDVLGPAKGGLSGLIDPNLGSLVPSIVNEIAQTKDEYQRDIKGSTLFETLLNQIRSRLPGKREELPVKETAFGQPIPAPIGFDPFKSRKATKDKTVLEAAEVGFVPAVKRGEDIDPKQKGKQEEPLKEYQVRRAKTLDLIKRAADTALANPDYPKNESKEFRKEFLGTVEKYAKSKIKKSKTNNNYIPSDETLKNVVDALLQKYRKQEDIDESDFDDKKKKQRKNRIGRQTGLQIERFENAQEDDEEQ